MPYIYKITNLINNKIYIGQTHFSIEKRWAEHRCDYKKEKLQRPIYVAMRKYGIENFIIEEIEEVSSEELNNREKYWIEYYCSFKYGYNATLGGDGKRYIDYDVVVETYKQIGNIVDTALQLNICTDSVKEALNINGEKIRSSQEVNIDKYGKMVNMFDFNGVYLKTFSTAYDAARYLIDAGLTNCKLSTIKTHISEVCKGRRKSAAKYKWSYAK